jgi:hypothetical protein
VNSATKIMPSQELGCCNAHIRNEQTIAAGELTEKEFPRATFLGRLREHAELDVAFTKARDFVRPAAHWGGGMIAALVPTAAGHRQLAIGIGGPADRLQKKLNEISAHLRAELRRLLTPDDSSHYVTRVAQNRTCGMCGGM